METTVSELLFLLDFGRFLDSGALAHMETEAKARWGGAELDDADLECIAAAGEPSPPPPAEEDGHGT